MMKVFPVFLCFFLLFAEATCGQKNAEENPLPASPGGQTTFDRIIMAFHYGKISLKDSVNLRAQLLFAPERLKDSEFAPRPGEVANSDSLTGFFKDVHRVFPELSQEERRFLASASEDLRVLIEARESDERRKEPDKRPATP
jgi:hypothetical protein